MLNKVCLFYTGKSHLALLNGNFTNWARQVLWANILKTSSLLLKYGHPANSYCLINPTNLMIHYLMQNTPTQRDQAFDQN